MIKLLLTSVFCLFFSYFLNSQSFTSTGGPFAIADGTGGANPAPGVTTCAPVTVAGVGTISGSYGLSSVCINITHSFVSDLTVYIVSPDGLQIPLTIENGGDGVNFTNTCFNMTAAASITTILPTQAPFTGNYLPELPLGYVNNGQNANGVWTLCAYDSYFGDVGSIVNFTLTFSATPAPPITCNGNALAANRCDAATPICNLNGYCGNTSGIYTADASLALETAFDNCTGGVTIENDSYIQFVASATTVNLTVNVTNSLFGDGIQMMVFSGANCTTGPFTTHGCDDQILPGTSNFTATGLTPGNTYFILIDGFDGDVCDYSITATSGVNVLSIAPATPNICAGGTGVTLTASGGNGNYIWSPAGGLSTTTGASVTATPAVTTTYTVTSGAIGSLNCPLSRNVTVTVNPAPVVTAPATVCVGNTINLTPSSGGTWISSNNAIATVTNAGLVTGISPGNVSFTFTNTTTNCSATTTNVNVTAATITPTFNAIAPICSGATAPLLPTTSTNGVSGTWSPATVSNTTSGTYTFTPNPGQCANTSTLNITVNSATTPTFNAITPFCSGTLAPVLPATSNNGITGTWSPSTVSNTVSGTYTFTPNTGQCATNTTLNVTVNPILSPTISCGTSTATSVSFNWNAMAGTTGYNINYSINGGPIVGGGVVLVNTYSVTGLTTGSNVSITIMPLGSGCFTSSNLTCTATPCVAQTLSLTSAPTTNNQAACTNLPITSITYSVGGSATGATITGLPPGVNSNFALGTFTIAGTPTTPGLYNYTVTTTGGCNSPAIATGVIDVSAPIVPTFNPVPAICNGDPAPILPGTSLNGINGTWSPATVSNTTSGTYTFTPNAGLCASSTTLNITVTSAVTPTFTAIPPLCSGSTAPILPTTSNNGINGTWSPASVSNTASATYTFTPNPGQCATVTTLNVTVNPVVTPTFNPITPFCAGTTAPVLPTTSNNGINGIWLPAVVNNLVSAPYTFTPLPGQCANPTVIPVIVIPRPSVNLGNDTTLCNATTLVLDAASIIPFTSYLWNTGATSPTITITAPGTYSVTVTNPLGCSNTDNIIVDFGASPVFSIGRDTAICPGQTIVLNTNITEPSWSILWQDGSSNPTFTVSQIGNYFVDVTNDCGTTRRQVNVTRGLCKILMPTAFSPNDDGKNDIYKAGGGENVTKYNLKIFGRWGQLLFESNSPARGWDGRFRGVRQQTGAYIYKVTYTDGQTNQEVNLKGTFMLLR